MLFTVIPGPTITGLSPTSGPIGASITITGTSFGATQGTSTVTFNGRGGHDDLQLECYIDCGDSADRSDDRKCSGDGKRNHRVLASASPYIRLLLFPACRQQQVR